MVMMENKQAFANLVKKEIKNKASPEEIQILESAPEQWRICLVDLMHSVTGKIRENQIDFKYTMETEDEIRDSARWKYNANIFRDKVAFRITAVKELIRELANKENEQRRAAKALLPPEPTLTSISEKLDRIIAHLELKESA